MKRPVIIDCDPGLDDMIALLLLGQEDIELLGITTVAGNTSIDIVTQNAINISSYFNLKTPVIRGAEKPLIIEAKEAESIHGKTGLGSVSIPQVKDYKIPQEKAYEFLINQSKLHKGKLEIIGVGPLTNIGLAIENDPDFENRIKQISIMGGGHKRGNVTLTSEFNIYADPHAAKIVFDSKIPKLMAGLDVTMSRGLVKDEIDKLLQGYKSEKVREIGKALYDILNISRKFDNNAAYIHDGLTVLFAIDPSFARGRKVHVDVETLGEFTIGMTVVDPYGMTGKPMDTLMIEKFDFDYYMDKLKKLLDAYES